MAAIQLNMLPMILTSPNTQTLSVLEYLKRRVGDSRQSLSLTAGPLGDGGVDVDKYDH